ncbi:MAG: hypothetical protein ACM35E_16420, partial [Deltaproteobacteria bacterium]
MERVSYRYRGLLELPYRRNLSTPLPGVSGGSSMETGGGAPGSLAAGKCGGWSNDFGFRVGR